MLTLHFASGVDRPRSGAGREVGDWRDQHNAVFARAFVGTAMGWIDWPGFGVFAFEPGSRSVSVWPADGVPSAKIADIFARVVQPMILQPLGCQVLHASAVVGDTGALAFCGQGGTGKSTLAYALGRAGFLQMADDATVLQTEGSLVNAMPLPFVPSLREASRRHFSATEPFRITTGGLPTPLRGILLLERTPHPSPPRVERVPCAQAIAAVLAHAHCFNTADPAETGRLAGEYLELVARVPTLRLHFFPSFEELPAVVAAVKDAGDTLGVRPRTTPVAPSGAP